MILVELTGRQPGRADLDIKRWKGAIGDSIEVAIQRNQDSHYLRSAGEWSGEITWHRIDDVQAVETNAFRMEVGPWLVDPLVQQAGSVQYMLYARTAGFEDKGAVRFLGNVLASSAAGAYERESDTRIAPEIMPVVAPVVEEVPLIEDTPAPVEPEPVVAPVVAEAEPKKKSSLGLIIGLILLLAVIGAAIWYFFFKKSAEPVVVNNPPSTPAVVESKPSTPEVTACTVQAGVDEMTFLQACLQTKPDDTAILAIIEQAKKEKQCGIAQRLYANKAAGGDVAFALAYAKEYDSAFNQASGCFAVDKEQALYWYNTVLESDPNHAEAKQRVEELSK